MQNSASPHYANPFRPQEIPLQSHESSLDEKSHNLEKNELLLTDKFRIFPVFGDTTLSSYSMNNFLYLGFFNTTLRILARLLLLVIFLNLVDAFFWSPNFVQNGDISDNDGSAECESTLIDQSDNLINDCIDMFPDLEPFLAFYNQHYLRMAAAAVASAAIFVFLVCVRIREKERVLNNPLLYDFNLTQDLFSVLIENIPLNVTQEELKIYLENQQPLKKSHGHVKEIILVQDSSKCLEISKQIQKIEEAMKITQINQNIELSQEMRRPSELRIVNNNEVDQTKSYEMNNGNHTSDLDQLSNLRDALLKEKSTLPSHNGKAIVVFNSIHTKTLVMDIFRPSIWRLFERAWTWSKQKTTLEESILTAQELPDPRDLLQENLYRPYYKNVLYHVLSYIVTLVVIIIAVLTLGAGTIIDIQYVQEEQEQAFDTAWNTSDTSMIMQTFNLNINEELLISALLMLIESIAAFLFRVLNKLIKPTATLEIDRNCFYYSICSSFVLYIFIQGALMIFEQDSAEAIAQITISLLCARYVIEKLVKAYIIKEKYNRTNNQSAPELWFVKRAQIDCFTFWSLKSCLGILLHLDIEDLQFNFLNEATRAFPLIILNFAFTANGLIAAPTILPSLTSRSIIPLPMILTLLALYIGAICDKYRLITQREDYVSNSGRFTFKLFEFLRFDHFACFLGAMIWAFNFVEFSSTFSDSVSQTLQGASEQIMILFLQSSITQIEAVVIVVLLIYFFFLVIWPSYTPLETQYQTLIFTNKGSIEYDQIVSSFTSLYRKPDLGTFEENPNETKSVAL